MLTVDQLRELLTKIEKDNVERTASTRDKDKFCEAICAFANDMSSHQSPGHLLIGVENDGSLSGLQVTDKLLLEIADLSRNVNLEPIPSLSVEKFSLEGGDVIVVEVRPSDIPPVRYKGTVWIRTASSRRRANRQEEAILSERRQGRNRPFDCRPCLGSTVLDLVQDLFLVTYLPLAVAHDVIAENDRELKHKLASLRFLDMASDCPTNAGILAFGKNPLHWIPGASVTYVRWSGTSMNDTPESQKSFSGDLISMMRELDGFIELLVSTGIAGDSALRERAESDYPVIALRELLLNALMHRSYESNAPVRLYQFSDRIEIQNPGGLYGAASPENFPRQNDYRNPVVAEALATLGYVNKYGRGVTRAQEALRRNGNPEAVYEFDHAFVAVTVRKRT